MKLKLLGLLFLGAVFVLTALCLFQQKNPSSSQLLRILDTRVLDTLHASHEIPGLKAEEFTPLKPALVTTWKRLLKEGVLECSGTDKEIRPSFVALQAVVEHVLASELQKEISSLKGIIHTPMPATPLCSKGEISKELIDPAIAQDPARLFTVKARTTIVRDYLYKGGSLSICYPQGGLSKRTEEQQAIYKEALATYSNHLFDKPLPCDSLPSALSGATYLFQDRAGNCFVFAIKMTQAKDPQEKGDFGLWLGPMAHQAIQKRLQILKEFSMNLKLGAD